MISEHRLSKIKDVGVDSDGDYVLYWMQAAQRTYDNHALEFAIRMANNLSCPLIVAFVIMPNFPNANLRHFTFMLQGIAEIQEDFKSRGIGFIIKIGKPSLEIVELAKGAKLVVFDAGYSVYERTIRAEIAQLLNKDVYQVETNLIVPIERAYAKEAYAAYAIRPSIMRQIDTYLDDVEMTEVLRPAHFESIQSLIIEDVDRFIEEHLPMLDAVKPSAVFIGGEREARRHLQAFIKNGLAKYAQNQSDPSLQGSSHLSPYLHFGQISPLTIAREVLASGIEANAYLEQLIVRRELAFNYIYYGGSDVFNLSKTLPQWALETLDAHRTDTRDYSYDLETLENGNTHDPYWNAAQKEMTLTGHMHGTMRMYWGKKVIEWTESPERAFEILCYLNDKYELDGRDPNGYAGIAWCFGKHDRPWKERAIFGKCRYMNAAGLERKYDIQQYVKYIKLLEGASVEK
jgi:deoxyribodipyrimidine photo-lyase